MICLECAVCECRVNVTEPPAGWLRMWISRSGEVFAAELAKDVNPPRVPFVAVEEIDVCGQLDALVAFERYLERGTFEPAPEAAEARPVDAFADLT